MAASRVKFLFGFLLASIILWLVLMFASRLLAWILSRIMGASVGFRVGGWKCLRDVVIKFKKGAVDSVSVGEIRLSLRQSLVKLGVGFISRDPKLQVLICDLEVVMRPSNKSTQKSRSQRSHTSGRGKWMVVANMARFLSVSITELVVKMPTATVEVKELRVDISKAGGPKPALFVKLHLLPIAIHLGEPQVIYDQSSNFKQGGYTSASQASFSLMERTSAPFCCEEFTLSSEFCHEGEAGVVIKNVDIISGEVSLNLTEDLFLKKKSSSKTVSHAAEVVESSVESSTAKMPQKKQAALLSVIKYASMIPEKPTSPIRSEIDVKLGGTQCNIIMSRLKPWMHLQSSKKKKMVLQDVSSNPERLRSTESKAIMWTCTVSAPEMTIMLYSMSSSPVYHGCLQSSHVFANNISSTGTSVHMELGELSLHMADEYQECLKGRVFGVETNKGSLMHIAKVSLDWGKKDMESLEEDGLKCKVVLSVDVTGMGIYLTFKCVESLISMVMSFKSLLKSLSASSKKPPQSRGGHSSKPSRKGIQLINFNLERCYVNFNGDVGLENTVVADPKHVNYGSQGGRIIISMSADGTPRSANIMSTISDECKKLKYSVSLDIFHLSLCMNKEKQSTQVELERARSTYQEYLDNERPGTKVVLFDMQNAKFVHRSGGLREIAICSLFSATDITVRWEPDVHIALFELVLQLKLLIHHQKFQERDDSHMEDSSSVRGNEQKKESSVEYEKQRKKRESLLAVDVEMLSISAEVGDGVDAMVQVQSIFSENASIGVLLEGLMLSFNEARVFKSSRMQISRIPNVSTGPSGAKLEAATTWDWVIQGLDVHICMPYRLQLRAIDDSIEEMLRALKLISAGKTKLIFPMKKESSKPKKPSSTKFGCVKFCIRKLTADIEEEPLQGWLDERYQLMKNEACELAARLKFLDELISKGSQCTGTAETKDSTHEVKILYNGEEIDVQDASAIQKKEEEIYKQSFRSYYHACQNLVPSEGSGACRKGFQAGFRPSTSRTSLLSISATELDVSLTRIVGGDAGMIEVIQKLDPVSRRYNIPFSRLYGGNILLCTGSLVVQLRNYTCPLFAATSGRCEGRIVLAQQATCFQTQIYQNVFIGRWRKVCMLRSASGTTPPMKTYSDLPIHFQRAEISFGVGFEPVFADISYAFTVALRRANLSIRNPNASDVQPPKKERSLPWWDDMRNYIHGNITLFMSETRWSVLPTTDPYEKCDKLQIVSGQMEIQQSDGCVSVSAKAFKILLSSLETLLNNCNIKLPTGRSAALLEAPVFTLEVTMEWECDSGNPMNHYLFALPNEGVAWEKVFDPFRSTSLSLRWDFSLRPSLASFENQSQCSTVGDDVVLDGAANCTIFKSENVSVDTTTMIVGAHDLAWLTKFWNMNYIS